MLRLFGRSRGADPDYDYQRLQETTTADTRVRQPSQFFRASIIIPVSLSVIAIFLASYSMMASQPQPQSESHLQCTAVTGYFLQDEESTNPDTFDYVSTNFGLIPRPYDGDTEFDPDSKKTQWQRFEHQLHKLNVDSGPDVSYKVLFLGRHGEGVHNVAERRYGTELWDCYWSLQPGDANTTWFDARLTDVGISQAQTAHNAWKTQIAAGIPVPQSFYVSPLMRCLETAAVTFRGLGVPGTEPFRAVVKELLRETIGLHTCDERSPKSLIAKSYPTYIISPDFAEADPLFDANSRESDSARDERLRQLLGEMFREDKNEVLSLTAHSGAITSILAVVGHRRFAVETGGVIPVLVKGVVVSGPEKGRVVEPWHGRPVCKDHT